MVNMIETFRRKQALVAISLGLAAGAVGCSSMPVEEIPSSANPADEMSSIEQDRARAYQDQVNVLAPVNFERAEKNMTTAREKLADGKDNETVLKYVARARAYLKQANEAASQYQPTLGEVLAARQSALKVDAPKYVSKDFHKTEDDLLFYTKKLEDGRLKSVEKARYDLRNRYLDLELRAIKEAKLAPARNLFAQVVNEGAKKAAPRTLHQAEKAINDTDAFITVERHNQDEVNRRSEYAVASADRLLKMTRAAKTAENKDSEELLLEVEAQANKARQIAQERDVIASEMNMKKPFELARGLFGKDEAEVFMDGDNLILRLKALNFPFNKDYIATENYPVLNKVQRVLASTPASVVKVQGHTDGIGSKEVNDRISKARAESVRKYLLANTAVPAELVVAEGYGYTKPITAEKTKAGRDLNRRVDIVIEPKTKTVSM